MTRAHRWVVLMRFFEGGGKATANQLALRYGVHKRTIQRDLHDISALIPLVSVPVQKIGPPESVYQRYEA